MISAAIIMCGLAVHEASAEGNNRPVTPIEHVVVIIGENLAFDTLFGAYQPPPGQTIANLLSKGIIKVDGTPGPNYRKALQKVPATKGRYQVDYPDAQPYSALPRPHVLNKDGKHGVDTAMPDDLPPGPFQITRYRPYTSFAAANPVHRFFQMWQQVNAGRNDLFVWTSITSGEGSANKRDPASSTGLSSEGMGFYNMSSGDLPYFQKLARQFAISDNFHQAIMGGTMPNYYALATGGDVASFLVDGRPATPPIQQIENPEPLPGTANWYTRSGYGNGSYTACADPLQPGVSGIRDHLGRLPYRPFNDGNCAPGGYYLVNNYGAPYDPDGRRRPFSADAWMATPQTAKTIAEALSEKGIRWRWYNGGRIADGSISPDDYSSDCDPLTFSQNVMESDLKKNLAVGAQLFDDIDTELPAVAFVSPPVRLTGHPGYDTPAPFEAYVQSIVERIQARPSLWAKTAILITTDEGGGYYDSGYVQAIDFFGDGTRIPFIAVSPWARKGAVEHTYYDHVSIIKFIQRNWRLLPLSARSRDNLPNPLPGPDPYVPANRPALGDLFEMFDFQRN